MTTRTDIMNRELTLLLEMQDLNSKVRELRSDEGVVELEIDHFGIEPEEAARELETKVEQLAGELSDPIRRRYQQIVGRVERVVVPVINEICYGCFVSVPAATAGEQDPNASLTSCQNCGRFLYFLN